MAEANSAAVLREILAALDDPGEINTGLAEHIRSQVQDALDVLEAAAETPVATLDDRPRMPTAGLPIAAISGAPDDEPPVPPAAL
jgi:hypothetical protein